VSLPFKDEEEALEEALRYINAACLVVAVLVAVFVLLLP